ncbi:MAG: hypothetical protein GEU95_13715 [Rhizobiales bacterium]|nr:hypothetical protein [Hyphomicrobiales bacterium]
MSVILLLLGILLSAAGGALIGFGIPIKDLSHGTTLILAGAFAVVGGLLLVGLSAVVSELARVTAALKLPQARAVAPGATGAELAARPTEAVAREHVSETAQGAIKDSEPPAVAALAPGAAPSPAQAAPRPVQTAAAEVSASAIERLRSSIPRPDKVVPEAAEAVPLSPNGKHAGHRLEPSLPGKPAPVPAPPLSAGAAAVATREPRLDFLFRPRHARQTQVDPVQHAPQAEPFNSLWPQRLARDGQPDPRLEIARVPAAAPTATNQAAEVQPAPAPQERTVAILKSGVVDGMAYTLYADGSIEAQLPQGTVRFGSIAELRAHIENNG